eukprot:6334801-Lingulodinium_polyedra.AAC.1
MLVPWERKVSNVDSEFARRACVDGLTFWKRAGSPDVVEGIVGALAATRRFESAVDWEFNASKSR